MFDYHEQERRDLLDNRNILLERMRIEYSESFVEINERELRLYVGQQNLKNITTSLKDEFGFNFFLNSWIEQEELDIILKVQLLNMDTHQRIIICFPAIEGEVQESLSEIYYGAFWCEQETWDMFGIEFNEIPKERILSPEGSLGFPMRKDFQPEPFQLQVPTGYSFLPDPRVPRLDWKKRHVETKNFFNGEVNGPVKAILECYDGKIKRGRLEIGYLHRGLEKVLETMTYHQSLAHLRRVNTHSSSFYEYIWCKGIEDYLEVYVPDRAKALRMIFNELERVGEHLDTLSWMVQSLESYPYFSELLEMKSAIYKVLDLYTRGTPSRGLLCIGGIRQDVPAGWMTECLNLLTFLSKKMTEITKGISNSAVWMERLCRYQLNSTEALSWGVTGPNLRASGVNYDLRKVNPYYFYDDVEFEIPLGIKGQCYDRYLVRVEEIFQSLSILGQLLDNLPLGEINTRDPRVGVPRKHDVYRDTEALIQHFKIYGKGISLPPGDFYSSVEAPSGELGVYVKPGMGPRPDRVKLRVPGFFSAQCFTDVVEESDEEDLPLIINSLNLVFGEIDR